MLVYIESLEASNTPTPLASLLVAVFKALLLLLPVDVFFLVRFNWGRLEDAGMCNVEPRGLPCFELELEDLSEEQEGEDTGGLVTGSLRPLGSSPLSSAELWSVWYPLCSSNALKS